VVEVGAGVFIWLMKMNGGGKAGSTRGCKTSTKKFNYGKGAHHKGKRGSAGVKENRE